MKLNEKNPKCLICNSSNVKSFEALTSGFITERMYSGAEQQTKLFHCLDCGFAYYELRPAKTDMDKLYKGYRNSDYQKQRQKYDCWYNEKINFAIGNNPVEVKTRKSNLSDILEKNIEINSIKTILDFGGDKGQYIPDLSRNIQKFVYDISGARTLENIEKISDFDLLKNYSFDLIMCNHVLEHLSEPEKTIEDLKVLLNPTGYIYLELPFDSPFYKKKFSNLKFLFNKYFKWSDIFKHYLNMRKGAKYFHMQEHINFFTQESIEIMLKFLGFNVISNEIRNIDCGWQKADFICVLAKIKND